MLCHSVEIPSGCFSYQDIGGVSGKAPASRETYWITDNLGMDTTSSDGLKEKYGCTGFLLNVRNYFSFSVFNLL